MTQLTSRKTSRTIATASVLVAASSLAACGNSAKTAADAPTIASSSSTSSATSTPSSSSSSATSATSSKTSKTVAPSSTSTSSTSKRASRSEDRQAPTTATTTKTVVIPASTTYVKSDSLAKGQTKVTTQGSNGEQVVTSTVTKLGDKVVSTKETGTKVTKAAVNRVVTQGTHVDAPKASATPKPSAAATPKQVSRSTVRQAITKKATPKPAAAKPAAKTSSKPAASSGNAGMWNSIASCESGNNWSINTGNGFYGGLQFTQQTWAGFGGTAYASRADLATPAQQMAIADKVMAVQGRGAWPVCGR